jgi:4-hydroxy-3-methylbut-2-enyl diphosphate reductase
LRVTIDPHSGFCFGVVHAIEAAERELLKNPILYCLGDIVHNNMEVARLTRMGLKIITHEDLADLHDCKVLIRAHGEPPQTYQTALQNNIELIDASCPIVLNLQNAIHRGYIEMVQKNGQIVIYGQRGHAEVNALNGQTNGMAIIVEDEEDLERIDFTRPVKCYSQTTKSVEGFQKIANRIRERMEKAADNLPVDFDCNDTICRQVSNRSAKLSEFAAQFDLVLFVSGLKSSNGMILYEACKMANPMTRLVSGVSDIDPSWFEGMQHVGICGATSTPGWLMEEIAEEIMKINN